MTHKGQQEQVLGHFLKLLEERCSLWGIDTEIGAAGVHVATGETAYLRMKSTEENG